MNSHNYCKIHTNNIAVKTCIRCSRGICSRCDINNSNFCPKCSGIDILKIEKINSKKEIKNIIISGFLLSLASILINTLTDNYETISHREIIINGFYFFIVGISLASSLYYFINTDNLDEIQEIPFIGSKLTRYLLIGSSFIGIPIIYFIYLIFKYYKKDEINPL